MNKIKYHKVRDCYYPDLKINENKIELTRFGSELLEYMQQHRNSMYFSMSVSYTHLTSISLDNLI